MTTPSQAAQPTYILAADMAKFLAWFEATRPTSDAAPRLNGLARAALAHLWTWRRRW